MSLVQQTGIPGLVFACTWPGNSSETGPPGFRILLCGMIAFLAAPDPSFPHSTPSVPGDSSLSTGSEGTGGCYLALCGPGQPPALCDLEIPRTGPWQGPGSGASEWAPWSGRAKLSGQEKRRSQTGRWVGGRGWSLASLSWVAASLFWPSLEVQGVRLTKQEGPYLDSLLRCRTGHCGSAGCSEAALETTPAKPPALRAASPIPHNCWC